MRLTEAAHETVRTVLRPGEVAIDATAGDGHDTQFLAECVGPAGRVYAFDIQPEAIEATGRTVRGYKRVTLILRDHSEIEQAIPAEWHGRVGVVMFNLGYRPGGDKTLTTRPETTLRALKAALNLIRPGGILTILAYRGHPGGAEEAEAVSGWLDKLPPGFEQRVVDGEHGPFAPRLFVVSRPPAVHT